jgi:hypothetical protein
MSKKREKTIKTRSGLIMGMDMMEGAGIKLSELSEAQREKLAEALEKADAGPSA